MEKVTTIKLCSVAEKTTNMHRRAMRIFLTSISSDSHTWNLVFLQLLIEKQGHTVINLGCCVSDVEIIKRSYEEEIDLVVVSTVNGHGYIEGNRLILSFKREKKIAHIPVVIGGKFGISGKDNTKHYPSLLKNGFDAVFGDSPNLVAFENYINQIDPIFQHSEQLLPRKEI